MTKPIPSRARERFAFTLIELLVVIAIIGVLAALLFPAIETVRENATRRKVKAELNQIVTAIDSYKAKFGFYPPDNPGRPGFNQLYYELEGTTNIIIAGVANYQTLDGSATIAVNAVSNAFGSGVVGFANCTKGAGDDAAPAVNFLKGLKPGQYAEGKTNGVVIRILTSTIQLLPNQPSPVSALIVSDPPGALPNPWYYNSSSPTNNTGSYDLWVDVIIGGKDNRISNWSEQPQYVN